MRFFHSESFLLLAAASLSLYSVDAYSECDKKVYTFLIGGDCPAGGTTCPGSCKKSLSNLHKECSKNGATLDGAPYDATNVLLGSVVFLAESPCISYIQNDFLKHVPDTCQSHSTIHMTASMLVCSEGSVCSQFCRDTQDGFYDTCTKDDVMTSIDSETGDTIYTTMEDVLLAAGFFMNESCKDYSEGKELKGSTGTSVEPIEPVETSACADKGGKPILWGKKGQPRPCEFAKKGKKKKCKKFNVAEVCPETCGECDGGSTTEPSDCEDSKGKVVPFKKNKPNKTCKWAKKNTKRCDKNGVAELCPKSCGMC